MNAQSGPSVARARPSKLAHLLGWLLVVAFAVHQPSCSTEESGDPIAGPPPWTLGSVIAWVDKGVLAEVEAPYGPLRIVRLEGSHYEMGYQYGYLLGDSITTLWDEVFIPYVADMVGLGPALVEIVFPALMDQAWEHMRPFTPQVFLDELEGVEAGAAAAGHPDPPRVAFAVRQIMLLAELSQTDELGDDLDPFEDLVEQGHSKGFAEYFGLTAARSQDLHQRLPGVGGQCVDWSPKFCSGRSHLMKTCSFFAVWGDRTDGRQLSSRNLDWDRDIGLQDYRLLTVFVPDEGTAHVTIGYVGFIGALAGMSEKGLAISHVGSTSIHERLTAEPGTLKSREILQFGQSLDDGVAYLSNQVDDGLSRPGTIGANAMLAYGDPQGNGAGAEAAAVESTGIFSSAFHYGPYPSCSQEAYLFEVGADGELANTWTGSGAPDIVNLEEDAFEVDAEGQPRLFEVDQNGEFVRDENGWLVDDPAGEPFPLGQRIPCALFRGDEALAHGVRKYQKASNGPQGGSEHKLMHLSGSYRERYVPQHDMVEAYYRGESFEWEGTTVIPDNGGQKVLIGPEEAQKIAAVAAMSSNVFSVIYDTTNLVVHVAYESGTGDSWIRAADNDYLEVSLAELLPQ